MNLANEIRAAFAKILQRYQHDHDALASMRVSHIRAVETHIDALEDRVARCTCQHAHGFEIDTTRETPAYAALRRASIDRMLFGVSQ